MSKTIGYNAFYSPFVLFRDMREGLALYGFTTYEEAATYRDSVREPCWITLSAIDELPDADREALIEFSKKLEEKW